MSWPQICWLHVSNAAITTAPETRKSVWSFKMTPSWDHQEPPRTVHLCSYEKLVQGLDSPTTTETAITIETKHIAMETQDTLYCYVSCGPTLLCKLVCVTRRFLLNWCHSVNIGYNPFHGLEHAHISKRCITILRFWMKLLQVGHPEGSCALVFNNRQNRSGTVQKQTPKWNHLGGLSPS